MTENPLIASNFISASEFPNPFNPTTVIRYEIPEEGYIQLKIYDLLGSEVATLVDEERPEGIYNELFDATNLPSGVYVYSLNVQSVNGEIAFRESKKMMLVK